MPAFLQPMVTFYFTETVIKLNFELRTCTQTVTTDFKCKNLTFYNPIRLQFGRTRERLDVRYKRTFGRTLQENVLGTEK
jgi:hypothetical protein